MKGVIVKNDELIFSFFTIFKGCMFIDSTNYKYHVQALIEENDKLKIAVAFWGAGAEALLESKSKKIKIICNLTSGGTNPEVIKQLLKWAPRVNVRHHDALHAKVFVGHNSAIIGSANMSTNGLNIESDEFDGWQEAGYLTDQSDTVEAAGKWFDKRWRESEEITDAMLKAAEVAWKMRSTTRIRRPDSSSILLNMTPAEAKGRNIFVVFYEENASPEAEKIDAELKNKEPEIFSALSYFEDGKGMKVGHEIISVRIKKDKLVVDGAYKVVLSKRIKKEKTITLQYVEKVSKVDDLRFTGKDALMFNKRLLALSPEKIRELDSWYVPFAEVLDLLQQK